MTGGSGAVELQPPPPLPFRLLPLPPDGGTNWDPASVAIPLNVRLDGCICPSEASAEGARIAYSHAGKLQDAADQPCPLPRLRTAPCVHVLRRLHCPAQVALPI